jgi:hypothetical protein
MMYAIKRTNAKNNVTDILSDQWATAHRTKFHGLGLYVTLTNTNANAYRIKKPMIIPFLIAICRISGLSCGLRQIDGSIWGQAALYRRGFEHTSQKGQTWQT